MKGDSGLQAHSSDYLEPIQEALNELGQCAHTPRVVKTPEELEALEREIRQCNQDEFQIHLRMIRSLSRGWNIVLFLDRAPSHKAEESMLLAEELGIA